MAKHHINDLPISVPLETLEERARRIVAGMTLREKIGQKIIIALRYWCPDEQPLCVLGMTEFNTEIGDALRDNAIGGVILFSDNLRTLEQTRLLIEHLRGVPPVTGELGLLMGVDEEGGTVFRLPRTQSTVFPGNMALGAAYEATGDDQLAYGQGVVLGAEIAALGFNLNFAPVVDVNSNPLNPVINVRAYGDDAQTISLLGRRTLQGMASQGVIGAFKHFPGHGDTATDSHYGLPVVNTSREDAYAIDLAPYRVAAAVEEGEIDRQELDASVLRIVLLKLRNGITAQPSCRPQPELSVIGSPAHRAIEQSITAKSITLIRNQCAILPLAGQCKRIFILMPLREQAEAIRRRFIENGYPVMLLSSAVLGTLSWAELQQALDGADTVILGTASTRVGAVVRNDDPQAEGPHSQLQWIRFALEYAKAHDKSAIHLSLRSPYDVVNVDDLADATLVTYSFHGYDAGLRGPSLPVAVDVMLGRQAPVGRLPVAIYAPGEEGASGPLRYARGFGLDYPMP